MPDEEKLVLCRWCGKEHKASDDCPEPESKDEAARRRAREAVIMEEITLEEREKMQGERNQGKPASKKPRFRIGG